MAFLPSTHFDILPLFILSLYSLPPFLPSLHIPFFSFSLSLLSFLLTLSLSLFTSSSSSSSFFNLHKQPKSPSPTPSIFTTTHLKFILLRSLLLAAVFPLRFQSLKIFNTADFILAELSGSGAAVLLSNSQNPNLRKLRLLFSLSMVMFLLSIGLDNVDFFLFFFPIRVFRLLLPFFSGFLAQYERISLNWGNLRLLGRRRVSLISLFFSTVLLFIPVIFTPLLFREFVFSGMGWSLWPLICAVLLGVLIKEIFNDEESPNCSKEIVSTYLWSLILGLVYTPNPSILFKFLACGLPLSIAVLDISQIYSNSSSESGAILPIWLDSVGIGGPIRQIMSERRSRKIGIFLMINTSYMIVEFAVGFMRNSLGLISDACHMLFDCAALAIGLYASYISRLPSNSKFSYGRGRFEVLSGYVNAVFLVLVAAMIALESFERILDPQEVSTGSLLAVSVGGFAVNVVGLVFFHDEHHHHHHHDHHHHHQDCIEDDTLETTKFEDCDHDHHIHIQGLGGKEHVFEGEARKNRHIDHNMEGIFLHVVADTMGSVGVVVSTLLIRFKGWVVADPACSIFISVLIVSSVVPLLRNSAEILLQRVPRVHGVHVESVFDDLMKTKGVHGVHDFHVWSLTNTDVVATLHLHLLEEGDKIMVKEKVLKRLHDAGINDVTLQMECIK